ncbi:hypothetical protein KIW84_013579 [Lathyrus oleraceus]|uniref:Retrotransposon gag domain-containing protein n=1 Tax=Pisum sativum TaxID=3888 RepID=A0A9D5BKE8_PEA|nr:hypothetical protein KIW84_013579 [Pisum sativum]
MENRQLKENEQEIQMELYKAKADRLNLAHKLKGVQGESASRSGSKKRSYDEIETMLDEEHLERPRLQKAEANYKKKIRDLERKLKDKDTQLKKEITSKIVGWDSLFYTDELNLCLNHVCMNLISCVYGGDYRCFTLACRAVYVASLLFMFRLWVQVAIFQRIAEHRPHHYATRQNQQKIMDQVQAELTETRTNMAQFMNMIQGNPPEGTPVDDAAVTNPVNNHATGDKLREAANARAARAPVHHPSHLTDKQEYMFTIPSDDDEFGKAEERDRKRIPYKFKAPSFDKYNGTSCPRTHVQAYYRKISAYTDNEKMWMYFFQDSLSGASLDWYMDLRKESIRSWRELGEAFLRQYKHNMDMAPSRTQL